MDSNSRYQEYLDFVTKNAKFLGPKGDYTKGEIEIISDISLFPACEEAAKEQMMKQDVSESDACERGRVGIHDRNRWGLVVCEPVKLPHGGALGTFARFIPWGQLTDGSAGVCIAPVLTDGRFVLLKTFRNATREWCLEFPRGTQDPEVSVIKIIQNELKEEGGASLISNPELLGEVSTDSGVIGAKAKCYLAKVEITGDIETYVTEAVEGLVFMRKDKFEESLKSGFYREGERTYSFSDSFTISTYALAKAKGLI